MDVPIDRPVLTRSIERFPPHPPALTRSMARLFHPPVFMRLTRAEQHTAYSNQ